MATPQPVGNDFRVNNTLFAGAQQNASVTGLATGGFVVAWESQNADAAGFGIRAQVYNSLGAAVGGEISVNTTTAKDQTSASVVATPDGGFFISWVDPGPGSAADDEIRGQAFNSSGNKVGGEVHINTNTVNDQWLPDSAALSNGNLVVVWTDNAGSAANIRAQVLNTSGQAVGSELVVTGAANSQRHPAVAGLPGGGYVVVWYDASLTDPVRVAQGARGQVFDNLGNPIGGTFDVTTKISGIVEDSANNPVAITGLGGGGYVVAWKQLETSPSTFFDIHAKVYNAQGALVRDDFLVNTTTAESQHQPAVVKLSDGGFVVTWSDNTVQDEVKGQRFDAAGNPNGAEFAVNSTNAGSQSTSDMALLADGKFVVTFTSDDAGNNDVRARVFDAGVSVTPHTHWLASVDIGPHPSGWLPAGVGDFNHDGAGDALWYNSATNDLDLWKLANGQWAGSVDIGPHPAGWAPAGIGDFNRDGTSDVLWYNAATRDLDLWKVANGQWAGSVDIGPHPAGWAPAGTGDFNNDGTSDVLWYNSSTGNADIWKISNGQWAGSVDIGPHPLGWTPVGVGDFNHDATSDVLWYNPTTRDLDLWKISNGQWAGSVDIGSHPAGWAPAGVGDFNQDGTSDVLWFNATTGDAEIWQIVNGQWAGSVDLGTHPLGWSPAGVGDFNHDGNTDILWREAATNRIETWLLTNS